MIRLILSSLLILASIPGWVSAANGSVSLLPNGSFEEISPATGRPAGWPSGRGVSWLEEDGKRFMRIESTAEGQMDGLHMNVPVPEGVRALELSYRGRVSGLVRGEILCNLIQ